MLTDTMRKYHVDTDAMQSTDADHTTLAVVSVAPGGERSFTFYRNPGADTRLDDARVKQSDNQKSADGDDDACKVDLHD